MNERQNDRLILRQTCLQQNQSVKFDFGYWRMKGLGLQLGANAITRQQSRPQSNSSRACVCLLCLFVADDFVASAKRRSRSPTVRSLNLVVFVVVFRPTGDLVHARLVAVDTSNA